ncbi:MAG: saccharopine dehydrogenase NADP-binding domain-containing protein [Actinomycetota bacterium]
MKVLLLGAAGKAGAAVLYYLRFLPELQRVYLADRNAEALCKRAADLAHLPVGMRYIEAWDEDSLASRMEEADLVLGCLGPFHLYEERIVKAAMATGRDYISLCDDPAALREVAAMGLEAARAGIRVLCGCGLTPGLSDLLASRAASRLDHLDSVAFAWFLELGPHLGMATIEHLLRSSAGKAPVRCGGNMREARAGSWEEAVEFPSPVGTRMVAHLSHPEPVAPTGAAARAREAWFKAGVGNRTAGLLLGSLARLAWGEKSELWGAALSAAASLLARRSAGPSITALRVTCSGTRQGVPDARTLCVVGDYYRISGLVMVAAARELFAKAWDPGVYAPVDVLDRPTVMAWMRHTGLRVMVGEEIEQAGRRAGK